MNHKKKPFLSAEWRNLVMINYEVDEKILLPYVPAKTELDSFNGKYYVSLVAFHFLNTRVKGISFPYHEDFEEVNLRFYVKFNDSGNCKRGVVFINEIVPKRMIAWVARLLYGEKYTYAPIKSKVSKTDSRKMSFEWGEKLQHTISVETSNAVEPLQEATMAQFILEHYWGYTSLRNRTTSEYQVTHPSWNIYPVINHDIKVDYEMLYGKEFCFLNTLKPSSVFVAEGSPIEVYDGRKL